MLAIDFTLIGMNALERRLRRTPTRIDKEIQKVLKEIGLLVQREARRNAPRLEGDLERSITYKVGNGYVDVFVPNNSRAGKYAKWIHDGRYKRGRGTREKGGRARRKYIKRAIDENDVKIGRRFTRIRAILRGRF